MSRGHRARALAPVSERGPEWKPEPAQERESARQAGDLAALRRMLDASRGCFSLSFAVCNDRGLRDQLIRQLTDAYPGIALVALQPHTPDVLQAVEARLGASTPAALFVLDLEASVPFQAAAYPTLPHAAGPQRRPRGLAATRLSGGLLARGLRRRPGRGLGP